jgi:hypothetical protein
LNTSLNLRYSHLDHSHTPIDVRNKPTDELSLEHCYYLGLRVDVENAYQYHHALILADDHETFVDGYKRECDEIQSQIGCALSQIALVFVRCMLIQEPQFMPSYLHREITSEVQKDLTKRNDDRFAVIGLTSKNKIGLGSYETSDALAAIRLARTASEKLLHERLSPLEVRQAHPVTAEFDILFHQAAERIKTLITFKPDANCTRH